MSQIKVNGTTLHYKEFGKGNKILISTQNFFFTDCHMELLSKPPYDYRVYLITMRGYGESEHVSDDYRRDWIPIWGEDVLAFAEAKGIEQFYYSGVSHGVWAGWYIALHKPEVLKGFVSTSGIPMFTPIDRGPAWDKNYDDIVGNRDELRKLSWNTFYPTHNTKRLARREDCKNEHLEIMLGREKEEFLIEITSMRCCHVETEEEYYERISQINVPILILLGMREPAATLDEALKLVSIIPGAQLLTYEHFEHAGPDECPEIVARDCDRFFKDTENRVL